MAQKTSFEKFREHVENSGLTEAEKQQLINKCPREKFDLRKALRDLRDLERLKELGLAVSRIAFLSSGEKVNPKGKFVRVSAKTLLFFRKKMVTPAKRMKVNPKVLGSLWVGGKIATFVGSGILVTGMLKKDSLLKIIGAGISSLYLTPRAYLALIGAKNYLIRKGMLKPRKRKPRAHRKAK